MGIVTGLYKNNRVDVKSTLTVCLTPEYFDGQIQYTFDSRNKDEFTFVREVQGDVISFIQIPHGHGICISDIPENVHVFTTGDEVNRVIKLLVEKYRICSVSEHLFDENDRATCHWVLYPNKHYRDSNYIQPSGLK